MQPTSSVFARFGHGVHHACARFQEAGAQFAASAAHQVERALASCRRTTRPQPAGGPAPHEVAPPLRQRQVHLLPQPPAGDTPDAQRLQRLHRYLQETEVAMANDPGQAARHVITGIELVLADAGVRVRVGADVPGTPLPGQVDASAETHRRY